MRQEEGRKEEGERKEGRDREGHLGVLCLWLEG